MSHRFDLSYQIESYGQPNPARHGKPWSREDYDLLDKCVEDRASLKNMCTQLHRSAEGVVAKLRQQRYLDDNNFIHYPTICLTKENIMNHTTHAASMNPDSINRTAPIIEHRTLIQGKDASIMDDAEIFQLIAKLEGKIASLQQIKAQSKKLAAHIEELQADVNKLVEFVDGR